MQAGSVLTGPTLDKVIEELETRASKVAKRSKAGAG